MACKQWNQLPADGFDWTGNSYDNTGELSAHVLAAREVHRAVPDERQPIARTVPTRRQPLADDERRLQALRRRPRASRPARPARSSTTSSATSTSSRTSATAARYCIAACPFGVITRSDDRRPRPQVHALLRPPARRPGPGLRQGLPDGVDPVRPGRRAARAGAEAGRGAARSAASTAAYLYGDAPTETYSELNSFYLLVDRPSTYGLPETPVQPVAAHEGRLRPRRSSAAWSRSPPCSLIWFLRVSLRCRCSVDSARQMTAPAMRPSA